MMQEIKTEDVNFPYDDFSSVNYESHVFGQKSYNGVAIISKEKLRNIRTDLIKDKLEQSRIIKSAPNRGFIIPELNNVIAKDLYQLVATLESLAIENSVYSKSIIKKLKKQQKKIETSNNAIDRVNEDIIFHNILTSQYKNETAQQILLDLKTRIFFYELEFMSLDNSLNQQHNQIINYLENGQIKETVKILKLNWLQVLDFF